MNSSLPRRPQVSLDYERRPRASPEPRRMSSPSYDDPYSARYTTHWGSDPYREYQRAPSPGVYDRYRDVSVDISWNKTTTWYHPRDYTHDGYSGRERRDSNGSATSRTFEPSSSWKQSNGVRDHERNEYPPLERYSASGSPRNYDRGNYYAKDSWPPSTPAYNQERSYTKDYRSPERPGRVSDSYRSAGSSHSLDTRSRKPRSPFRSPRRHYRSRSRSRSRSSSRSFSRSPSPPAKRSMLPTNRFDSDRYQDASTSKPLPRIPTGPRLNRTTTNPSSGKEKTPSRSPSQSSSIASSRETSVKPSERISDQNDDKARDEPVTRSPPPSPEGESNILYTNDNEKQDSTPLVDSVSAPAVTNVASVSPKDTPLSIQASRPVSVVPESAPPVLPDPVITTPRDPIAEPLPPNDDHATHPRDIPDYTFEDIPDLSNASNVRDAVRVTIMRRLLSDRQTRRELVEPVLYSNLSMPKTDIEEPVEKRSIYALMTELTHPDSDRLKARTETSTRLQQSLVERFKERQHDLKTKVQRLTEEYIALHEKWKAHCAMLDRQVKSKSDARTADIKAVLPNVVPPPPMSGRTTRRSAATLGLGLGDAVRSDLEMEQIIASIGSNEATDPNQLCLRNIAVIPDMISVVKGKVDYVYDDNNLLVEDPVSYYATQSGIHDWTEEEKQIFVDKYAIFPKQFGAISRFLPNKTTAQCVDFYYLHKNVDIDFRALSAKNLGRKGRRRTAKRKTNALLADIRLHDAEVSAAGSANARSGKGRSRRAVTTVSVPHVTLSLLEPRKSSLRKPAPRLETPTTATPTPEPEARPKRRRVASARLSLGTLQTEIEDLQIPVCPQ
ncbi:hypothetical protein BDP27DRAFT_31416 [Rhodocollybia butyracea]|uniref:SANT domain-containing protein n=1 Tax=Rhodocollybia butyracea TaxID=206335 RepID=A0A9P5QAW9_9AGAR|nr:hypothetical protein BDP27DRAFT_31416 [Rhodocollybia butyracea]